MGKIDEGDAEKAIKGHRASQLQKKKSSSLKRIKGGDQTQKRKTHKKITPQKKTPHTKKLKKKPLYMEFRCVGTKKGEFCLERGWGH